MFDFPIKLFSVKTKLGRASDTGTGDLDNDLTAAAGNISANEMRVFELWTNENPSLSDTPSLEHCKFFKKGVCWKPTWS